MDLVPAASAVISGCVVSRADVDLGWPRVLDTSGAISLLQANLIAGSDGIDLGGCGRLLITLEIGVKRGDGAFWRVFELGRQIVILVLADIGVCRSLENTTSWSKV